MKTYEIQLLISYSGSNCITIEVDAESEQEAFDIAYNKDLEDEIDTSQIDIEIDDADLLSTSEKPEPRCKDTKEMF